jgi:hydroxyacylglutathione hydrolase
MSAIEIMDGFFFFQRGYLNGNHFAFRSTKPILVDTGYISDFARTEELLGGLGLRLSDVQLIINTHCHCDHIGGNRIIQEKSGCDIYLHKIGKYFVDTRDDWATWWKYYDQGADFFKCTRALEDGDILAIGPHEFEVLHMPGHAADQIVLYNKRERVLLSSDALWERDVRVVYPGHGRPFHDMKGAISRTKETLRNYLLNRERVASDLLKKIIVYTLMMKGPFPENKFFSHLCGTHWFKETVDLYFGGEYEKKYSEIMRILFERELAWRDSGNLYTLVKR